VRKHCFASCCVANDFIFVVVKKSLPDNGLVQGVPCSHPAVVCCTWEVLIPLSK
jgi:hypothetical protein